MWQEKWGGAVTVSRLLVRTHRGKTRTAVRDDSSDPAIPNDKYGVRHVEPHPKYGLKESKAISSTKGEFLGPKPGPRYSMPSEEQVSMI